MKQYQIQKELQSCIENILWLTKYKYKAFCKVKTSIPSMRAFRKIITIKEAYDLLVHMCIYFINAIILISLLSPFLLPRALGK